MTMPPIRRVLWCLLTLAVLLPAAGCDWLTPSGSTARSSPVITDLAVGPPNAICGPKNTLTISFGYHDPQGDYNRLTIVLEEQTKSGQPGARVERSVPWTDLDLTTSPGRAIWDGFFFTCGVDPVGTWKLTAILEDERGHLSNELTATVNLASSL
ncbi:MAG TPA: hypothetical protein VI078_10440 [bacterium]